MMLQHSNMATPTAAILVHNRGVSMAKRCMRTLYSYSAWPVSKMDEAGLEWG